MSSLPAMQLPRFLSGVQVSRRGPAYPRFDVAFIGTLLKNLQLPSGEYDRFRDQLRRYHRNRRLFVVMELLILVAFPIGLEALLALR